MEIVVNRKAAGFTWGLNGQVQAQERGQRTGLSWNIKLVGLCMCTSPNAFSSQKSEFKSFSVSLCPAVPGNSDEIYS